MHVALNIGLTELRRKRWRDSSLDQLMQTDDGEFTPSFVADLSPRPEALTERRELLAYVSRLIGEELTEKQRTALVAAALGPEQDPDQYPAQRIAPEEGEVVWFLDSAAGSEIEEK